VTESQPTSLERKSNDAGAAVASAFSAVGAPTSLEVQVVPPSSVR